MFQVRFSDVSMVYRSGTLVENGFKVSILNCSAYMTKLIVFHYFLLKFVFYTTTPSADSNFWESFLSNELPGTHRDSSF